MPLSAATGYQNQWQNAGTLEGHSHEAGLGIVLASKADYFWSVNFTADRTRQSIEDLKVGAFLIGPSEGTTNTQIFRIAKGEPFGVIYGAKWIKTADQLAETIKTGQLGGTATDYKLNEEGFYVRATDYHTIAEVPLKAFFCDNTACATSHSVVQIGDVNPDFNSGLSTNATYKSLSLQWNADLGQGREHLQLHPPVAVQRAARRRHRPERQAGCEAREWAALPGRRGRCKLSVHDRSQDDHLLQLVLQQLRSERLLRRRRLVLAPARARGELGIAAEVGRAAPRR